MNPTDSAISFWFKQVSDVSYAQASQGLQSGGSSINGFLQQGMGIDFCWSCNVYKTLFNGMDGLILTMYRQLVENSPELITLATIIALLALCLRVGKMIATPFAGDHGHEWRDLYGFLIRLAVVYVVFLTSATTAGVSQSQADQGKLAPVSDLFIMGPLALGTEIGSLLMSASCDVARSGGANLAVCQGGDQQPSDMNGYSQTHVFQAQKLLLALHQLGVSGIAAGTWIATQLPSTQNSGWMMLLSYMIAGLIMAGTFFMLTLTFGFRYVDALLRMMVVCALAPIFFFLWIFESTRHIAQTALRSVLTAGAAFAVSGLVITTAAFILDSGFKQAFGSQGASGMFSPEFFANMRPGSSQFDWMSYFYLLGCALIVQGLAKVVFDLSQQLFQTGAGLTGVGAQMEGQAGAGVNFVRKQTVGRLGI
ncbi:hypothetical protein [Microvirga tunisiensis]|uniref:Type IV secretion system protein n=1 Tax=Microvirga tunisiensis TaxID=2108360 RepID=A0A5N7MA89_9HYPH|nr:hypothetical protein [Microvirga tunisiensis]MPR05631.1 hypothetical protein [Microvirga tunisiensis]MPR23831.1 hypothetical protein [Microvirga tunisiensis]